MASNMAALVALVALLLLQLSVAALDGLCHPSPCGVNTLCEVVNNVPTCKCEPGYYGSPLAGCRHECENNNECGTQMACIEFMCQNPCSQCGHDADQPECTQHSDCPPEKPACFYNSCKNPCDGVCGIAANCDLRNGITPVCSCPEDMTGDAFVMCRSLTKVDLYKPNLSGTNAVSQDTIDTTRNDQSAPTTLGTSGTP